MEEQPKRGPGRPPKSEVDQKSEPKWKRVRFVQMHDAFTPLQLAPILSLAMEGSKAMELLEERPHGIYVVHKTGREFLVPYANISFYEYDLSE